MTEVGPPDENASDKAASCLDFVSALQELDKPDRPEVTPVEAKELDSTHEAMERFDQLEAKRYYDTFVTRL